MYVSRSEGSFINTVSTPPSAFDELLQVFSRHYVVRSGLGRRGRPPALVVKHAALACVLHSYAAAVEAKTLSELFGIPPATLSRVLHKAGIALDKALQEIPDAQARYPSKHQRRQWARRVQEKEPLLDGWLHAVLVTGTLCYGVDGTLVRGRHNLPGSWNDGKPAANYK
ncbi:hypothetical protein PR003_g17017 [Phytophthora rubi]|uniref:DDE Tnp4 domain-containing protein n=1 Tax=Phytophthora rubi TaxID=129364 RepID=A0A6A4EFQ9_9STRA|nr:hypothetical protein PR003_g17017 [Phytophthora rubi]